jgi:hypothetical protein
MLWKQWAKQGSALDWPFYLSSMVQVFAVCTNEWVVSSHFSDEETEVREIRKGSGHLVRCQMAGFQVSSGRVQGPAWSVDAFRSWAGGRLKWSWN